jgi:hypothetical protein
LGFGGGTGSATWTLSGVFNFGAGAFNSRLAIDSGTVAFGSSTIQNLQSFTGAENTTVNLGTSTISVAQFEVSPLTTVVAGTSTLAFISYIPSSISSYFITGGHTYATVSSTAQLLRVTGNLTASVLSVVAPATPISALQLTNSTVVCTTSVSLRGNSATNRLFVFTPDTGGPSTISAPARTLENVDFRRISAVGSGVLPWALGTSVGDCQGNTNILFTPTVTRYAVASGAWNSTAVWGATSVGPGGASVPLPQDDVQFTSGSGNIAVTTGNVRSLCRNLYMANFIGTLTLNRQAASSGTGSLMELHGDIDIQPGTTIITAQSEGIMLRKIGVCTASVSSPLADITLIPAVLGEANIALDGADIKGLTLVRGDITLSAQGNARSRRITNLDPFLYLNQDGTVFAGQVGITTAEPPTLDFADATIRTQTLVVRSPASVTGGTSTVVLEATLFSDNLFVEWEQGTLHNVTFSNAGDLTRAVRLFRGATPEIERSNRVTGTVSSRGSANSVAVYGYLTMEGDARFEDLGRRGAPVLFGVNFSGYSPFPIPRMQITNNTGFPLQTENVFFSKTTALGTMSPAVVAFGLADLEENAGSIVFQTAVKVAAFSGYSGSWEIPSDFGGSYYVMAFGAGGQGAKLQQDASLNVASGGGGGGAFAVNFGNLELAKNQLVWINAPAPTGRRTTLGSGLNGGTSYLNYVADATPTTEAEGVAAQGGFGATTRPIGEGYGSGTVNGGQAASSVGQLRTSGGFGSLGAPRTGSGGGSPAYFSPGFQAAAEGFLPSTSVQTGDPATGGAGIAGISDRTLFLRSGPSTYSSPAGSAGGAGGGGQGGLSSFISPQSGLSGSMTLGGGGGGGGGLTGAVQPPLTYVRNAGTTNLIMAYPNHGFSNGDVVSLSFFTEVFGTGSRSGTLITVPCRINNGQVPSFPAEHGFVNGQTVFLQTQGSPFGVPSGNYVVTVISPTDFSFVAPGATGSTPTTITVFIGQTRPAAGNYTVTVNNADAITLSLAGATGTSYTIGTVEMVRTAQGTLAGSGGNGGMLAEWTYTSLNGVPASGVIGPGGGGGGGGGAYVPSGNTVAQGGAGGDGGIGAGGGGGGSSTTTTVVAADSGSGGAGLVIFVYGVGFGSSSAQLIG